MSKGFKKTMQAYSKGKLTTVRGRQITDRGEAFVHACAAKKAEKAVEKKK